MNINYVVADEFINSENTIAKVSVTYSTNPNDLLNADIYSLLMARKNGSWVPVTRLQLASSYVEYPNIPGEYIKILMTPKMR